MRLVVAVRETPFVLAALLVAACAPSERVVGKQAPAATVTIAAEGRIEGSGPSIDLSSAASGRVKRVLVDEQDRVTVGQLLLELDCAPLTAEITQYQADLLTARHTLVRVERGYRHEEQVEAQAHVEMHEARAARANADRQRASALWQDHIISKAEYEALRENASVATKELDSARARSALMTALPLPEDIGRASAQIDAAAARVQMAALRLEQCQVLAPISGVVLRRHVEPGEGVDASSGTPLITVADTSRYRVRIEVDEVDIGRIRLGQHVGLRAVAFGGATLAATISSISGQMGRKTVFSGDPREKYDRDVLEVIADIHEGDPRLRVGLRVTAIIQLFDDTSASSGPG